MRLSLLPHEETAVMRDMVDLGKFMSMKTIVSIRMRTDCDLKTAKDAIEDFLEDQKLNNPNITRRINIAKFAKQVRELKYMFYESGGHDCKELSALDDLSMAYKKLNSGSGQQAILHSYDCDCGKCVAD